MCRFRLVLDKYKITDSFRFEIGLGLGLVRDFCGGGFF